MMEREYDTLEEAQQAADAQGDNHRLVYQKPSGKYGFDCLIEALPHLMWYEQRKYRVVSERFYGQEWE